MLLSFQVKSLPPVVFFSARPTGGSGTGGTVETLQFPRSRLRKPAWRHCQQQGPSGVLQGDAASDACPSLRSLRLNCSFKVHGFVESAIKRTGAMNRAGHRAWKPGLVTDD